MTMVERSRPLNKDKLSLLPRDVALVSAHYVLRPLSNMEPEEMVAGMAVLFASVCNRVGLDPQHVHQMGMRMLKDQQHHDKGNKLLQSLRDFAGLRIAGQDVVIS